MVVVCYGAQDKIIHPVVFIFLLFCRSSLASTISDCLAVYGNTKSRSIVFCETKKECNELVVNAAIKHECAALHGDIPQSQRETTMAAFREGRVRVSIGGGGQ